MDPALQSRLRRVCVCKWERERKREQVCACTRSLHRSTAILQATSNSIIARSLLRATVTHPVLPREIDGERWLFSLFSVAPSPVTFRVLVPALFTLSTTTAIVEANLLSLTYSFAQRDRKITFHRKEQRNGLVKRKTHDRKMFRRLWIYRFRAM